MDLKNIISTEIYTVFTKIVYAFLALYNFREEDEFKTLTAYNKLKYKISILSKQIKKELIKSETNTEISYEGGKTYAEMKEWLHKNLPHNPLVNTKKKTLIEAELMLLHALTAISASELALDAEEYSNSLTFMRFSIESLTQAKMITNPHALKIIGNEKITEITAAGGLARAKEYELKKEEAIKLFEAGGYSSYDACANAIYEKLGVKSPRTVASWLSKHYKEKSRKE